MQNGYLDDVPVDRVKEFQKKMREYLSTRKADVLPAIRDKKAIDKDNEPLLKSALDEFKQTFR